jgi:hypothetical protein
VNGASRLAEGEEETVEEESQTGMLALRSDTAAAVEPASTEISPSLQPRVQPQSALKLEESGAAKLRPCLTKICLKPFTITKPRSTRLERSRHQSAGRAARPMLYSYLLDPTYSSHRLPTWPCAASISNSVATLAEAADITGRLTSRCAKMSSRQACQALRRN